MSRNDFCYEVIGQFEDCVKQKESTVLHNKFTCDEKTCHVYISFTLPETGNIRDGVSEKNL